MKLNEIAKSQDADGFFTNAENVRNFLIQSCGAKEGEQSWLINGKGWVQQFMGTIDLNPALSRNKRPKMRKLKIRFGMVKEHFKMWHNDFTTLEGCPQEVGGTFSISFNPRLKSLKFLPKKCKNFEMVDIGCFKTSLVGIADALEDMEISRALTMDFHSITEGGIGLINVRGLRLLVNGSQIGGAKGLPAPFVIIENYLGQPDKIFECQEELINAGYEEFAKL